MPFSPADENGGESAEDYFSLGYRRAEDLDSLDLEEDRFHAFMDALLAVSPAPVYFETIPGGRNGCYGHAQNEVYVSWCLSPAMTIHTTVHEIAHAILHPWPEGIRPEPPLPRAVREAEAEGTAQLVCLHYGLDVSAYSVDYIRSWVRHLTAEEAESCAANSRRAADMLCAAIDAELGRQRAEGSGTPGAFVRS